MKDQRADFKVDFIGVGPQRTGTSWTHEMLILHPELCLPTEIKETMYFDLYFDQGDSWHQSHFVPTSQSQYFGEISPTYFDSSDAIDRIHQHNRNCKIIISIRNPIDLAVSLYQHELSIGNVTGSIKEASARQPQLFSSLRYSDLIPIWAEKFDANNIFYLWLDDIKKCPENTYAELCKFLRVAPGYYPESLGVTRVNKAKQSRNIVATRLARNVYYWLRKHRLHSVIHYAMKIRIDRIFYDKNENIAQSSNSLVSTDDKRYLSEQLSSEISYLEKKFGKNLNHWR